MKNKMLSEVHGYAQKIIEDGIHEMFNDIHEKFSTDSGDISPCQKFELDDLEKRLALLMAQQVCDNNPKVEMKPIAIVCSGTRQLLIYDVPKEFESEEIEEFIDSKGLRLNDLSWGEFDGVVTDNRED